jgi:peroxisomal membrane protein 2
MTHAANPRTGRKVWTLTQYINLQYVPVQFRVLFANIVALGWNTYLAVLA